jgi:multidrug efflux pump
MMSGFTVATMLTIVFIPALYAAWFKVRRQPRTSTDMAPVAGGPAPAS